MSFLAEIALNQYDQSGLLFPPEWAKAALVLALISIWIVIALFAYLNRTTKKSYFSLWTVAWMFYSVYLAAAIGLTESPHAPFLVMSRRACIGISALFMFWGSFQVTGKGRSQWELALGIVLMVVWSYVAAYKIQVQLWITVPVFVLLAAAGFYTGGLYLRRDKRYPGAKILAVGFSLWGLHLLAFSFIESSPGLQAAAYLTSAALSFLITVGMVVEHEITLSEQNYRALLNSASDAMLLVDYETLGILEVNPSARRLADQPDAEWVGRSLLDLFPDLREATAHAQDRQTGALLERNARRELRLPRADGQCLVYETQQQVIQQERLRALEEMASGLAHDFNNALARILGFNELLLTSPENLKDPEKVRKYLQMINAAALDAVKIVNRLREFYRHRQATEIYEPVDLLPIIEQAVVLTQPKWKDQVMANGATVHIDLDLQEVPMVHGSSADLTEVLVNLIFNGVDAMPAGGTLTLATHRDNAHAVLEVRDTGSGMTEEVRQRCLEPFYSTKQETGSGLGLAIVYGIVQRHGGRITIQSQVGKGTAIIIHLPVQTEPSTGLAPVRAAHGPSLNVLLVEDDPNIRDIEAAYLRGDGHAVVTATNGQEGLATFRATPFDLVVADRAMPEMNGDQMTDAIKSLAADTPVIMVTGFADRPLDNHPTTALPDLVLAKPITQATLRQAIAAVTLKKRNTSTCGIGHAPEKGEG